MQINTLELNNFRNYETLSMCFSDGVNIIYGENGQGKTNILESIYLCGLGKSHRKSKEHEMVRFGEQESHIKAEFQNDDGPLRVDVHIKPDFTKGIAVNRMPLRKISELYGRVSMVLFSPENLDIINRGPAERRNFINLELCQIDPIYVDDLISYTKILKQRHELFKKMAERRSSSSELMDTLDIWDLQLVNYGSRIIERRRSFAEELNDLLFDIHYEISGGREKLKMVYEPSVSAEDFYENLLKNREKDCLYKQTSVGPHRDEFSFYEKEKNLRTYGSQGQKRTCVLSLKLAELKILEQKNKDKPILLLDDVLSELDRSRQQQLLKSTKGIQTIITGTGIDEFVENEIGAAKKFHVKNSELKEITSCMSE